VSAVAGAVVGAIVGGLGSRLSMRLIREWTEGPPVTLTGAIVGQVSLDGTLQLVQDGAVLGIFAGLVYAAFRWVLPPGRRTLTAALLALLLPGGAILTDTEFEEFTPSLLTAALFVPIFPVGAVALDAIVQRLVPRGAGWSRAARVAFVVFLVAGLALFTREVVDLGT
jgi:hypothetical protein